MSVTHISSKIRDYSVNIVETTDFLHDLECIPERCYVVDENVWQLYTDNAFLHLDRKNIIIQPVNEEQKGLSSVQVLYDRLIERTAKRNITLISIGGGIVQDITGFVASTLYRGIHWIYVPTTLLAQADSCIGSKTSLNYKGFKNLIGTFFPPNDIFVYLGFLATLQDEDFSSGVGEVVKLHILGGEKKTEECASLLERILKREPVSLLQSVQSALTIKQSYILDDEFDTGRRNMLNYGHCFGHALEATSNYQIPHGQAVLLGMILANKISRNRGVLSESLEDWILKKLLLPSLTIRPKSEYFNANAVVEAMKKDKKRTGENLALIMLKDGYEMESVKDLSVAEATTVLKMGPTIK